MEADAQQAIFRCKRFERGQSQSNPGSIVNVAIGIRDIWSVVDGFVSRMLLEQRHLDKQRVERGSSGIQEGNSLRSYQPPRKWLAMYAWGEVLLHRRHG